MDFELRGALKIVQGFNGELTSRATHIHFLKNCYDFSLKVINTKLNFLFYFL